MEGYLTNEHPQLPSSNCTAIDSKHEKLSKSSEERLIYQSHLKIPLMSGFLSPVPIIDLATHACLYLTTCNVFFLC